MRRWFLHKWQNIELVDETELLVECLKMLKRRLGTKKFYDGKMLGERSWVARCLIWVWKSLLKERITVNKSLLLPTLLSGRECWMCPEKTKRKLNKVGMGYWKRICGRTREGVKNSCVMEECILNREGWYVQKMNSGVVWFYIYRERMNEDQITRQVHEGKVHWRGRPR